MRTIDFRSDTQTLPSPNMLKAIQIAKLGDDVTHEDPTVNDLEKFGAELLGKESSVLVSSGTMGNLIGVLIHCNRGEEVIAGALSHICRGEAGGISVLGGVAIQPINTAPDGSLAIEDIEAAIKPDDYHFPITKLISVENTHNATGGKPLTASYMNKVRLLAQKHSLKIHVDGARLFNAAIALETPVKELVQDAETVSICLSKGLSAPVGSLLCGSEEDIAKARRIRKMLGGGMRQAGIIAAAGKIALTEMVERLAEDHSNARKLALGLAEINGIEIQPEELPTNLVFFKVPEGRSKEFATKLGQKGIKVGEREDSRWRLVTHYGITSDDIDYSLEVINNVFS
ncbi:MAG: low-specificity L-threonine aldolase [SAR202 cluster bacterium]|nr:low-specificity L-threonine aldolase [SAR202 cluster bacterium]|tara:strand:- start:7 stop:1035 length:1029 start_codon:yes stop_codon:yes gene_type:complete